VILPKRGEIWTYKERAKFFALAGSTPLIVFLVIGIALGIWPIILVSVIGLLGAWMIWLGAERKFRDEP
jgi:hypothetical protein